MTDLQDFLLDTLRRCDGLSLKELHRESELTSWAASQHKGGQGFICTPIAVSDALATLQAKELIESEGNIWKALRIRAEVRQGKLF